MELESARRDCGCRTRLKALARLRSAAAYEGPLELAIHRFKYQGWRRLAEPLAQLIAERIAIEGVSAPNVVSVPLHERRLRERGFNQSELLAREVRARFGLARPEGELVRTRYTLPQVGHDRRRRADNVHGAFVWRGAAPGPSPLLLIDDVATTGATLEACAAALRAAGSGPVIGVSVARVAM